MQRRTPSTHISTHALKNIIHAFDFAEQNGTPLTAWVTVHWAGTEGWSDSLLTERMSHLLHRAARWFRRHKIPQAHIWVIENARLKGLHAHMGFHVPHRHFWDFVRAFPSWVPGHQEGRCIIEFNADQGDTKPKYASHPNQRGGQLRYILKGMNHRATITVDGETLNLGDYLGIQHRGQQGAVDAKRCGTSHSLGRIARARAGYRESSTPDALASILDLYRPANDNQAEDQSQEVA